MKTNRLILYYSSYFQPMYWPAIAFKNYTPISISLSHSKKLKWE